MLQSITVFLLVFTMMKGRWIAVFGAGDPFSFSACLFLWTRFLKAICWNKIKDCFMRSLLFNTIKYFYLFQGLCLTWKMKYESVTIQMETVEQYFHVAQFIMLQGGSNFCLRMESKSEVWPFKWKLLSCTFLWCCLLCYTRQFLLLNSVDEILKCDHSNESYWAVLSCGAVYYAAQGGSIFWGWGWNPKVWPFIWKLPSSTFLWCCFLCCTKDSNFESVDEILQCDHSNESYWAVNSYGTVHNAVQGVSKFLVCGWNRPFPNWRVPLFSKRVLVHSLSYENEFSFTRKENSIFNHFEKQAQDNLEMTYLHVVLLVWLCFYH